MAEQNQPFLLPEEETTTGCCCSVSVQDGPISHTSDCCRTKHRSEEEYTKLLHRLSRIEGQIRGIKGMLGNDAYCTDILVQVTAVNAALNAFSRELLSQHIRTCVMEDIRAGKEETVEDLLRTLQKMMK